MCTNDPVAVAELWQLLTRPKLQRWRRGVGQTGSMHRHLQAALDVSAGVGSVNVLRAVCYWCIWQPLLLAEVAAAFDYQQVYCCLSLQWAVNKIRPDAKSLLKNHTLSIYDVCRSFS